MSGESTVMPPRKLHDADVVYLYDGSFEGFLCCVFESFAQHEIPFAVWTPQRETATLYPVRDIGTDSARAQRVFSALGRKLGRETEYLVSRDFLSGQEDKELLLIRFLHLAFALGPGTVKRMGHPDVAPLYEMKKSLDWEVDKFQGFVRFEEHDGMLGAVIHPKNYILPLLRGHFCSRFPEENFMIYDAVHQAVLLYQEHKAQLLELARAYRFSRSKAIRLIYLPSLRPYFLSALITSVGLAWKSGVAAEVLCTPSLAMGTQIYSSKLSLEIPDLFAWTAVVVALSLALERGLRLMLEQKGGTQL